MASLLSPRVGISLTEVLIAMGILTIGLLGVAAIFPVGSYYMQQGEIANRGSAIAQAAFNEVVTNGTLNPENWLVWEDGAAIGSPAWPPTVPPDSFLRPFSERLRRFKTHQRTNAAWVSSSEAVLQKYVNLEFGSVFVIDPIGVASVAPVDGTGRHVGNRDARAGAVYPASTVWTSGGSGGIPANPYAAAWVPWGDNSGESNPRWPIRRVTLAQPFRSANSAIPYQPLNPTLAQKQFSTTDDLVMDVPTAQSKPAIQPWQLANLDGGSVADDPVARQSRGNYSWIVTVSPTTSEARDALATDPSAYSYEVSVVVFYKRPVYTTSPPASAMAADERRAHRDMLVSNERGANARIVSTGLNGGEVLLTRFNAGTALEPAESPFDNLKTGHWIMLCGPHPNSTNERPMMTARWYRVLSVDGKDRKLNASGNYDPPPAAGEPERRLVALRGPQWPWQPADDLTDGEHLSNALYVCIPRGAVAVHAKSIRLEGKSVWAGGGTMPAPLSAPLSPVVR